MTWLFVMVKRETNAPIQKVQDISWFFTELHDQLFGDYAFTCKPIHMTDTRLECR